METRASYMIVGAFVFLLFASAMGFVIWLGKLELDKSVNLYEIGFTGSVTGLSVASPVRYRGIPVGQVTDIQIDSENVERIDVTIEVDSDIRIKATWSRCLKPGAHRCRFHPAHRRLPEQAGSGGPTR